MLMRNPSLYSYGVEAITSYKEVISIMQESYSFLSFYRKCYIIPVKNSSMNINEVCHCT